MPLVDRQSDVPERFDDVIEYRLPDSEQRLLLLREIFICGERT